MPCMLAQLSCIIIGRHITNSMTEGIKRSLMSTSFTTRRIGHESGRWPQLCARNWQLSTVTMQCLLLQCKSLAITTTTKATTVFTIVETPNRNRIKKQLHYVQKCSIHGIMLRSTTTATCAAARRQKSYKNKNNHCNNNNNKNHIVTNDNNDSHNDDVPEPEPRVLVIFDFDMTIVSQDTDMVVAEILSPSKLNNDLLDLIESDGWMAFMLKTLQYLQEKGITAVQIAQTVRCVPEVPGMVRLIRKVSSINAIDLIIVSDANTFFITEWLNAHNLRKLFTVIISNPAQPKSNGHLALSPFTHQTKCQNCPSNFCKGAIFEQLLEDSNMNGIDYKRIIYVGDGENDYCAVSRMQRCTDIICARRNFDLAALLNASEHNVTEQKQNSTVAPQIILWSDGCELLRRLQVETTLFNEMFANGNTDGDNNAEPQCKE